MFASLASALANPDLATAIAHVNWHANIYAAIGFRLLMLAYLARCARHHFEVRDHTCDGLLHIALAALAYFLH